MHQVTLDCPDIAPAALQHRRAKVLPAELGREFVAEPVLGDGLHDTQVVRAASAQAGYLGLVACRRGGSDRGVVLAIQ